MLHRLHATSHHLMEPFDDQIIAISKTAQIPIYYFLKIPLELRHVAFEDIPRIDTIATQTFALFRLRNAQL